MNPPDLYHHIVAHSGVFGIQTVEAKPTSASSTPNPEDICLLINVSPKSLGPTTTPQLSKLLQDTQENYSIRIITLYKPRLLKDKYLKLVFYLLLVNKYDQYPRLTCDSPHLSSSKHPEPLMAPLGSPIKEYDESDLNFSVRKRRRKLGFGSLATPSAASQVVINMSVIGKSYVQPLVTSPWKLAFGSLSVASQLSYCSTDHSPLAENTVSEHIGNLVLR